ncbi:MAG: sugar ABC transporter substrate-binding protein, partial [Cyanobacteria bacterium M_DeepCast_200m_mx_001]|nr:sugar ABC transporter substrate-binding protein [Cyanobacteria bacterium M_DeepCast_200m_mx_001]
MRLKRLLPAMGLAAALLSGCVPSRRSMPVMLYVAVAVQEESSLTSENTLVFRQRWNQLVRDFQRVHPNVLMQLSLYPEGQLRQRLLLRDRAGLGPDLILTGADSANTLLRVGLSDPIPEDAQLRAASSPALLQRLRNRRGQLAAQPMVLFPQLACYDRRRLPAPPTSLSGLLDSSAAGVPVGLPIDLRQLLWTAGGFGAIPGLTQAGLGQQPSPIERSQIRNWLAWLQQASDQQRVTFMPDQTGLRQSLSNGALAWVSCNSGEL